MAAEPDNLILHMLREMRDQRASDMRAIADAVASVRRSQDGVNRILDRLDEVRTDVAAFRAEMVAFRGETDRSFRRLDADIATLEGRGWDRQAEGIEATARFRVIEDEMAALVDRIAAVEGNAEAS